MTVVSETVSETVSKAVVTVVVTVVVSGGRAVVTISAADAAADVCGGADVELLSDAAVVLRVVFTAGVVFLDEAVVFFSVTEDVAGADEEVVSEVVTDDEEAAVEVTAEETEVVVILSGSGLESETETSPPEK